MELHHALNVLMATIAGRKELPEQKCLISLVNLVLFVMESGEECLWDFSQIETMMLAQLDTTVLKEHQTQQLVLQVLILLNQEDLQSMNVSKHLLVSGQLQQLHHILQTLVTLVITVLPVQHLQPKSNALLVLSEPLLKAKNLKTVQFVPLAITAMLKLQQLQLIAQLADTALKELSYLLYVLKEQCQLSSTFQIHDPALNVHKVISVVVKE